MDYPRTPEHNILRALPFFLLFLLLALMGWAGYRGYKSAHPRPKPTTQLWYEGRPCKGADCREAITASTATGTAFLGTTGATDPPFMLQCNDGGYVTDLRECREYHQKLIYAINRPRKHKRTTEPMSTPDTDGYFVAGAINSSRLPPPTYVFSDCDRGVSGTSGPGYSNMVADCNGGKVQLNWKETPAGTSILPGLKWSTTTQIERTPAIDFEKDSHLCMYGGSVDGVIRPCSAKELEYDQLALDHSDDFYDNVFVPGGECTDRERYRELQCQMGGKCLLRNLDSKNWCPVVEWHLDPPAKPDCKMPADIDVCPAQRLDPKKSHD